MGFMSAYLVSLSTQLAAVLGSLVMESGRILFMDPSRGMSKLTLLQSGSGTGDACRGRVL